MRIVSWNCNGKFREKRHYLYAHYPADMYLIQECENPEKYDISYSGIWLGDNNNRGLGVYIKQDLPWSKINIDSHEKKWFCPVQVGAYIIIAIWAKSPYIEEVVDYFLFHESVLQKNVILMGDLNSNVIWDRKRGQRDHSSFNRLVGKYGLVSAYHTLTDEKFGHEQMPTFYLYRHLDRPYHIDYAYLRQKNLVGFGVGAADDWLSYSDHVPIWLDVQ